jgi:hypothetical protein
MIPFPSRRLAILLATSSIALSPFPVRAEPAPNMDWVPPEAMSDTLRADTGVQIIPEIQVTATPKSTADLSKFTKEYLIELEKFGIFNDGTHADETSKGLNAALQHAKTLGANRIVFPAGTYLISEEDPVVIDHKNTVIDLNGATLQIRSNGLPRYAVVKFVDGAENARLTNGTIRGDKDTHDYKTKPGTHEWGTCLRFQGGVHLEADHLVLTNASGDGVSTDSSGSRDRAHLLSMIIHSVHRRDLEQGAFSESGEKIDSEEKTRTIKPYDLTKAGGEFEFGYMGGYAGFPFIKGRVYQVYFYDKDLKFLEKKQVLQYRKVQIPEGGKFAHFEFNQPEVAEEPAHVGAAKGSWIARINNFKPPREVHLHHNQFIGNRRLGLAFTGGQRWVIEENHFEATGGTAPGCGVDFEDSAELMQDVVFRKNTFKNNKGGDLALCAGTEILVEENVFQKTVVLWGRPHNYVFRRNHFTGGTVLYCTRTGIAKIHDNTYTNCKISARFDTKGVADGLVREPGKTVSTPALLLENETLENVSNVEGTYLNFKNSKMRDTKLTVGKTTSLVSLVGCTFENVTLNFEEKGPNVTFVLENNTGELLETGAGAQRKMVLKTP